MENSNALPINIQKAIRRQESVVKGLEEKQHRQQAESATRGISPAGKNALLRPTIQEKLKHQRLREHIASEWDLAAKYPLVREDLGNKTKG